MGIELEYKLAVANPAQLEQILFDPQVKEVQVGDYQIFEMATIYYDTPDRRLGTLRWTLRLRQENNQLVATLKTPYQGKIRGEWSCEAANIQEAVPGAVLLGDRIVTGEAVGACAFSGTGVAEVMPLYLRPAQAERLYKEQHP